MASSPSISRGQYLHGPCLLRLDARQMAPIGPSDVRIRIRSTTLCGSDVHYFKFHKNGSIEVKEPLCGGHEAAGEIVEVGPNVLKTQNIRVGDRVAIESGVACLECAKCSSGRYNICPRMRFRSSGASFPHFQGTLQEYVDHPAEWCHRLPNPLTYDDGALLEPLSVCIHSVNRASVDRGASCLVFGAGAVGLLCAAVAKIEHTCRIVIADIDEGRIAFALEHGFADIGYLVSPKRGDTIDNCLSHAKKLAAEIGKLSWPEGEEVGRFDHVFECTGVESCVQASIYAAENGGNVVLVGMGTAIQTWPVAELTCREINVVSMWRYVSCYPRAIEIVDAVKSKGLKPDLTKVITHRFSGLDTIPDAYETASRTRDAESHLIIKVAVNF
ncbi:alcohol dehydrogenase [Aspergillus phoenicis ATCC 13157]|uniref:Alcohol dehydrogenase n=1 Tax=Aspergillus phoenicis ATCC 13157 TaxID=1353007 RepID=A0A370PWI6_ASPPH|nr:alcohol dehydrogenase [Aspergillus phoenicis ATCC 13157]